MAGVIDIIGTGESSIMYDWTSKNTKWSVASAFNAYKKDIDLYFALHDNQVVEVQCITQKDYPLPDIIDTYGSKYFTCSIAYMIAYAMYTDKKEINLFGIDMYIGSEYEFERPCILYWIGRAEGEGIKVNTTLSNGNYLYGYETNKQKKMLDLIKIKMQYAKGMIANTTDDLKNQWLGRLHTLKEMNNIIRT